jgi:hypothetical protein
VLPARARHAPILEADAWVVRIRLPSGTSPPNRRDERQPSFEKGGNVFLVLHREEVQGLAEYGLIISIIAVLAVVALLFISGNLDKLLSTVGKGL